jgi:hypothetical protein
MAPKQMAAGKITRFRIQNHSGYGNMSMFAMAATRRIEPTRMPWE